MASLPPLPSRSRQAAARRSTEALRALLLGYRDCMEAALRVTGITLPQLRMLKAVDGQSEGSAASIARLCQVTPQTLQTMLTRATREGWITRAGSARNGRILTASLTPAGRLLLDRGLELASRIEADIWHGIPVARMQEVQQTLARALANLDRLPR